MELKEEDEGKKQQLCNHLYVSKRKKEAFVMMIIMNTIIIKSPGGD